MHVQNLNFGFGQMMQVIPVGLLHLERLNFTPAGIERGELIHSVPLAPAETINITHKEWSNTSEEFEKIVTDYQEGYSEQGVTEKAELSQSTTSQEQHSTSFNTGVTASGSYGGVTITAAAGYNAADSATISQQASRNQSVAVTRMASSRVKKEHKISFKVASAAGTEDEAVQRFTNPFDDKATRVDFYQLVRKWKVNLFRYGIRLTYDLTIPEPGLDITSKIQEINSINDELGGQISFSLAPQGITRTNYMSLAAQYGATLDAPPVDVIYLDQADTHSWTDDQSKQVDYRSFIIEVPSDYKVTSAYASYSSWVWDVNNASLTVDTYFPGWVGQSGKLPVIVE